MQPLLNLRDTVSTRELVYTRTYNASKQPADDMTRRKDGAEHNISFSKPLHFQRTSHIECDPQIGIYNRMDEFLALATTPRVRRSPTRLRDRSDATRRMPQNPRIVKSNTKPKLAPRYKPQQQLQQQNFKPIIRARHEVHVLPGPSNPTGLFGLPKAWESILLVSGIFYDEIIRNMEALVDVLNFRNLVTVQTIKI